MVIDRLDGLWVSAPVAQWMVGCCFCLLDRKFCPDGRAVTIHLRNRILLRISDPLRTILLSIRQVPDYTDGPDVDRPIEVMAIVSLSALVGIYPCDIGVAISRVIDPAVSTRAQSLWLPKSQRHQYLNSTGGVPVASSMACFSCN